MKRSGRVSLLARMFILAVSIFLVAPFPARADVAPPQQPPGTTILPGSDTTQVRMLAETVTLTVLSTPSPRYLGQAKTEAVFLMRNLGTSTENLQVRFPLTFWNNESDGFGNYPEIPDIQITVDDRIVPTHRIDADFLNPGGGVAHSQAPWAAFDVSFPPGKDVRIGVRYTTNGYGYAPYFTLRYILETGAGWKDTIGTADVIVRLPYEASRQNALVQDYLYGQPSAAQVEYVGREVRWHLEDFEPTAADNIQIDLAETAAWQKVLDYQEYVRKYPNDGEGWGQLGKSYKEVLVSVKGFYRTDPGGEDIFALSSQAYQKAVTLLPKDALWHYGFADLLWWHHWAFGSDDQPQNLPELQRTVDELRQSLALDPKNQKATDLADTIARQYPWAVSATDRGYDYLLLTATPVPELPEATAQPSPTAGPALAPTPTILSTIKTVPLPARNPFLPPWCGAAALLPALAGLAWYFSRRH